MGFSASIERVLVIAVHVITDVAHILYCIIIDKVPLITEFPFLRYWRPQGERGMSPYHIFLSSDYHVTKLWHTVIRNDDNKPY